FCDHCQKSVHDVSVMTAAEASALLAAGDPVCVRFYLDASGAVMTAESGSRVVLERRTFAKVAAAGFASALLPLLGQERPSDRSALLFGQVTDQIGTELPNATVRLKQDDKTIREVETDSRGVFRIHEKPGPYKLIVSKNGWRAAEQAVNLRAESELKA